MFPKMCLFKTENSGNLKNIQHKFLKNAAGIELKQLEAPEREGYVEIQGPVPRETDSSLVSPAIDLNQLCTGIFHLLSSQ